MKKPRFLQLSALWLAALFLVGAVGVPVFSHFCPVSGQTDVALLTAPETCCTADGPAEDCCHQEAHHARVAADQQAPATLDFARAPLLLLFMLPARARLHLYRLGALVPGRSHPPRPPTRPSARLFLLSLHLLRV